MKNKKKREYISNIPSFKVISIILFVLFVCVLIILQKYNHFSYKNLQYLKGDTSLQDNSVYVTQVNQETSEFVNHISRFRFEFSSDYNLEYSNPKINSEWKLSAKYPSSKDGSRGEYIIGAFSNYSQPEGTKYERTIITSKRYTAKQYITLNTANHPQGLGALYTVINEKGRTISIYTFIGGILEDLYRERMSIEITNNDFENILNNKVQEYNKIVDTFMFL